MAAAKQGSKKVKALVALFNDLSDTNSSKAKEELLRKFKYQPLLKKILTAVFKHGISFGVTSSQVWNKCEETINIRSKFRDGDKRLKQFLSLLVKLSKRKLSGNAAIEAVGSIWNNGTEDEIECYERILNRNLRLGVAIGMVTKLYPKLIDFPVQFMLAGDYSPKLEIKFPVLAEPKRDGIRLKLKATPNGSTKCCDAYTRKFTSYRHLFIEHLKIMRKIAVKIGHTVTLDCEVFVDNWNRTSSLMGSGMNALGKIENSEAVENAKAELVVYAFDFVIEGKEDKPLIKRKAQMEKVIAKFKKANLSPVFHYMEERECKSHKALVKAFKAALKRGDEGIMIKDIDAPYESNLTSTKRSSFWLKYKDIVSEDVVILEVLEGQGRLTNTCGSLAVRLPNKKECNVSGMNDAQRAILWKRRSELPGTICEIMYQNDPKEVATARFPRFVRMRWDK